MARQFNSASLQYLSGPEPLNAVPLSIAGWFYPAATNVTYDLLFLRQTVETYIGLYINPTGSSAVVGAAASVSNTERLAVSSGGTFSANTWNHAAGVFASTTSRIAYLNGVGGTANTQSSSPAPTTVNVGGFLGDNSSQIYGPMNGRLAEIGIWNVALTAPEIAALARGVSPLRVRPSALMAYWPLSVQGASIEANMGRGGSAYNLTVNNGPIVQAAHPPVMLPFGGQDGRIMIPPTAPAGRVKVWNGTAWVLKPVKIWTGSAWITKPAKIWNGSSWV